MNFTIFRNFSRIFLNLIRFISIFKCFNLIKKMQKNDVFIARVHVASPRGQARAPTWRGGDVALTWTRIYMFIKYMGLPCIGRQIINTLLSLYII